MAAVEAPFHTFTAVPKWAISREKKFQEDFLRILLLASPRVGSIFGSLPPPLRIHAENTRSPNQASYPLLPPLLSSRHSRCCLRGLLFSSEPNRTIPCSTLLSSRKETNSYVGRFPHFSYLFGKKTLNAFFCPVGQSMILPCAKQLSPRPEEECLLLLLLLLAGLFLLARVRCLRCLSPTLCSKDVQKGAPPPLFSTPFPTQEIAEEEEGGGSRLGTSENETPLSPQPDGGEGREQPVSEAFFGGRKEEKKDDDEQEAGMHVGVRRHFDTFDTCIFPKNIMFSLFF